MKWTTQAGVNTALVVMSVLASILLLELGLQLVGYMVWPAMPGRFYFPRDYYKADPVNGFDIAANFPGAPFDLPDITHSYGAPFKISSNSMGCRDRPFNGGNDYVLLIGDSMTWGFVPLEHTWGTILENHLGLRVLKCGVPGYGPRQERHKLEAVVAQAGRPLVVVVGYFVGNDLVDDYLYPQNTVIDGYLVNKVRLADQKRGERKVLSNDDLRARRSSFLKQKPTGFTASVKGALAEHSALYDKMRKIQGLRRLAASIGVADPPPSKKEVVTVFHSEAQYPWLRQAWEDHLENLRQLKQAAETVGAAFFVVIIPDTKQVYEFLRPQGDDQEWEYPNTRLAEYFQREGILFLDLLPEFLQHIRLGWRPILGAQDLYWPYNHHLNIKGNRLAGLLIGRDILEGPFLDVHDKRTRLSNIKQLLSAETDVTSIEPQ